MDVYRKKIFPALAECLWLSFLFLDLSQMAPSTWVKFAAICLCCLTALLGARTPDGKLVAAALCFTVGADWFLLVRNDHYLAGVGLFLIVQALYSLRIYRLRGGGPASPLLALRLLPLVLCGQACLFRPDLLLPGTALVYFFNLCLNALEAFSLGKDSKGFAWGLVLFVCCDVCVGAWNLSPLLPTALTEFARVGMWMFYLPSQVLIVLSAQQEGDRL